MLEVNGKAGSWVVGKRRKCERRYQKTPSCSTDQIGVYHDDYLRSHHPSILLVSRNRHGELRLSQSVKSTYWGSIPRN